MSKKIAFIMDPIESIKIHHDTTFGLMFAAQKENHAIYYILPEAIYYENNGVSAKAKRLKVFDQEDHFFEFMDEAEIALNQFDAVFLRKDPPFDMRFLYLTYLLEQAEREGAHVINRPASVRAINEKLAIMRFPELHTPTLVSSNKSKIKAFVDAHKKTVVKPLNLMGGQSIYLLTPDEPNINVILDAITDCGKEPVMVQAYIDAVIKGDKRILLLNGEPIVNYAVARIPSDSDFRANMAAGGHATFKALSKRDLEICHTVSPMLKELGLNFVGLDVIGDYLTEINVTSPTCLRELENYLDQDLCMQVIQETLS